MLRRVDSGKRLGCEDNQLVGRNADNRSVFVQCFLNCPWPPSGEPVVRIPEVGNSGESWPWKMGQGMKVEQVDNAR
jgi:hypothetical protein